MSSTERKPRILYLTPGCFDKGGISRYSRYQVSALRDLCGEHSVDVYSVLGPGADSFEDPFDVRFYAGGIGAADKTRYLLRVAKGAAMNPPDLVLAAHVNLSGAARMVARATRASCVLNVYGREVWSGLRVDSRWGLRGVEHLLSDCHFTARYLEDEAIRRRGTTSVVWDCVDLRKFTPGKPRPEVLAKYSIPDPSTGKNLLTLGRMSPSARHKGYEPLLDVFSRVAPKVPELRLIYAGRGELVDQLRAEAQKRGLADRVFFTGMVHEDDMCDVYRSAHIFSLVSTRYYGGGEGIPLTPLEAAACGSPILVGNRDGSQEAVIENANGFVIDSTNLDQHASRIEELATDDALHRRMSEGARATAIAEFSYEGFREKHRSLLDKWLSKKSG